MSIYHDYKICLLGDTGVGKSCIVHRYVNRTYSDQMENTIGASYMTKDLIVNNNMYRLNMWDTAGQERFKALAPMYYRECSACIIVYSIDSKISFDSIQSWIKELKYNSTECTIAIVGNKCDIIDQREVSFNDGKTYAESKNAIFMEVSAKTGQNINELFYNIVNKIPKKELIQDNTNIKILNQSTKKVNCCENLKN